MDYFTNNVYCDKNTRRDEFLRQAEKMREDIRNKFNGSSFNFNKKYDDFINRKPDTEILTSNGIVDRRTWLLWLKRHHTDKGGQLELCQRIVSIGRANNW